MWVSQKHTLKLLGKRPEEKDVLTYHWGKFLLNSLLRNRSRISHKIHKLLYICMYACMYTYIHTHTDVYIHRSIYMYIEYVYRYTHRHKVHWIIIYISTSFKWRNRIKSGNSENLQANNIDLIIKRIHDSNYHIVNT
jgi:hypothetical protein